MHATSINSQKWWDTDAGYTHVLSERTRTPVRPRVHEANQKEGMNSLKDGNFYRNRKTRKGQETNRLYLVRGTTVVLL